MQWRPDAPDLDGGAGQAQAGAARVLRRADDARAQGGTERVGRRLRRRHCLPAGRPPARAGRLAHARLAGRVRRPRRHHARSADLHRPGVGGRGSCPVPDDQHGRADDHAIRDRRAEGFLPAQDRRRGAAFLDRLLRARGGHRPGRAAHQGGPRRRRVRHQRPEDVDLPDRLRRLRLAGLPDRSAGAAAQRTVDHHRADQRAWLLLDASAHHGRDHHKRDLLRRRPGARWQSRWHREPGLAADHQSAQPRAGGADLSRAAAVGAARGPRLGSGHQAGLRRPGDRRRMGKDRPGQGARQDRSAEAAELADRRACGRRCRARARPGNGVGDQGLRHRADRRGMPRADGGAWRQRPGPPGLAGRRAGWQDRADAAVGADPDVRRRHQRDPARHDRDARARPAVLAAVTAGRLGGHDRRHEGDQDEAVDFSVTQAQDELSALSRRILADKVTPGRLAEIEQAGDGFDAELWAALAGSDILAAALPEAAGGAGYGLAEQCTILIELGRALAPVPYLPSIVLGAGAIAEFGAPAQITRWAEPAGAGTLIVTAALAEADGEDPAAPGTRAETDGHGWLLTGTKTVVAGGAVERTDPGVAVRPQLLTGGAGAAELELAGVRLAADRLVGPPGGGAVARWLADQATVGLCARQLGVTERALELTAEYATSREQFGRPIGAFQAVAQRLADAHIDVAGIALTMWQAAWRLQAGLPCRTEIATAKFWAADAGHRVAHTAVHVHGGVGIDTSYPLHRYFTAAKDNEFALGGATAQLRRIGAELAGPRPAEPADRA